MREVDVVIVGAGPGGMTAGIYAKRAGKSVVVLEKFFDGGLVVTLDKIDNYPSWHNIDGFTLSEKMSEHAKAVGVEFVNDDVVGCDLSGVKKIVKTPTEQYVCRSVIIATGARPKQLSVSNAGDFAGRGLSYCATCDGKFFEDKYVAVVGTKQTAEADVKYLSNLCKNVYFVTSEEDVKFEEKNVEVVGLSKVVDLLGDDVLEAITIENLATKEVSDLEVDGLFVVLGKSPEVGIFSNDLELDKNGFIKTNERMQTNIPGVFAVGDVRSGVLKQIVTACADGAIAGTFA